MCNQFQSCTENPAPVVQIWADHDCLITVLEKQNEIISMLVEQQSLLLLLPKLRFLMGIPCNFRLVLRPLNTAVKRTHTVQRTACTFLSSTLEGSQGSWLEAVSICLMRWDIPLPNHCCENALLTQGKLLLPTWTRFLRGRSVASEDVKALQAYCLLLRACCNTMGKVGSMHELDVTANMQSVIKKLPFKLRDMWRSIACDLQDKFNRRVNFQDIVEFIERKVRIISDPMFGDIQDSPVVRKDWRNLKALFEVKGSSFATIVIAGDKRLEPVTRRENYPGVCLFCGAGHTLDLYGLLQGKMHAEKMSFLRQNGICFGCLHWGQE